VKGTIENIEEVRRGYAFEIFKRVVQRTPVDTGLARGNWLPSTGSPSEAVTDTKDKSGNKTIQNIKAVVEQAKGDEPLFLVNNLPYIEKLEYGRYPKNPKHGGKTKEYTRKDGTKVGGLPKTVNGWSRQAPSGMVGTVLSQAEQIFKNVVNAVKGGNT
jgi:hypothetical protein